jgi:hypothetical protein
MYVASVRRRTLLDDGQLIQDGLDVGEGGILGEGGEMEDGQFGVRPAIPRQEGSRPLGGMDAERAVCVAKA